MIKHIIRNNKLLTVFDVVRFITSVEQDRFNLSILDGVDDYRIILTHGVIGEVINLIENDYYGLDKSKLIFLCNNIELTKLLHSHNLNAHTISEYIYSDDDMYRIYEDVEKYWDCIFPGRESKTLGIFNREYNVNLYKMYKDPAYPIARNIMPQRFNEARCGLMTTETEGSCLSVGEMLLCGLPVVTVDIVTDQGKDTYYPINKHSYKNTYDIVLPHTLGGRELWLDETNSVYCNRNDDDIEIAINVATSTYFDKQEIRNDFMSKLSFQRHHFVYLLKGILNDLDMIHVNPNDFINLPYGNSTINTTQWNKIWPRLLY
jgi:hypothetical protein